MNVLSPATPPDNLGRQGPDTTGRKIRGAFVVYPDLSSQTGVLADEVRAGPTVTRQELLQAVDRAESVWQAHDPGAERDRALKRLSQDRAWLGGSTSADAASLAEELKGDQARYLNRQEKVTLAALGVCVGCMGTLVGAGLMGHPLGFGLGMSLQLGFLAGAGVVVMADNRRKMPPQGQTMERLLVYQNLAAPSAEVNRLAQALAAPRGSGVEVGEQQVVVGGIALPRRGQGA